MNEVKIKCKDCLFYQNLNDIEGWCIDFECNLSKRMAECWRYCLHYMGEVE